MVDPTKRFEIVILRPLQVLFVATAVVFLSRGAWLRLVACGAGAFYLGVVGSKLHPLQSASDLAQGPLEGTAAVAESESLPYELKQTLLGHACTRVGIRAGVTIGVVLWARLGWRWYFVLPAAYVTMMLCGASLKLAFKAPLPEEVN